MHVDDLFAADARWSATGKCTPGEGDCPPGTPDTAPIRMTAADVDRAVAWQQQHGFTLDMLYNAAGSDQLIADTGSDPLTAAMLAAKDQFRWMNHTYTHEFMGCQQDFTVIPWRCATDPATGQPIYATQAFLDSEIAKNIAWAATNGVTIRADELVAGEHSGTKILPQQPDDNPNFVAALTAQNIKWLGMDASREPAQRGVGSALGVPRHPINIFYNVANPDGRGLRVQLDLHLGGRRRQRDLHREPGDDHLHRPARPGHRVHRPHRARAGPDHARLRPDQRPAAVLRPPVEPGRERPALPRARPRRSTPTGRSSRGARRWSS